MNDMREIVKQLGESALDWAAGLPRQWVLDRWDGLHTSDLFTLLVAFLVLFSQRKDYAGVRITVYSRMIAVGIFLTDWIHSIWGKNAPTLDLSELAILSVRCVLVAGILYSVLLLFFLVVWLVVIAPLNWLYQRLWRLYCSCSERLGRWRQGWKKGWETLAERYRPQPIPPRVEEGFVAIQEEFEKVHLMIYKSNLDPQEKQAALSKARQKLMGEMKAMLE